MTKQSQLTPSARNPLDVASDLRFLAEGRRKDGGGFLLPVDWRAIEKATLLEAAQVIEQQASALKAVEEVCGEKTAEAIAKIADLDESTGSGYNTGQYYRGVIRGLRFARTAIREAKE
jgi:hypothetical protein